MQNACALGPSGQAGCSHRYGEVVLSGKKHPEGFIRGYGSYRMQPFVKAPEQCFNRQRFDHMARTCWRETQTCRYCVGSHPSSQCKEDSQITLKCANCGEGHATTSKACPKRLSEVNKSMVAQKKVERSQTPTAPTGNAWTNKYVPTMELRDTAVYSRYVTVTVFFRTTVVYNPYVPITVLFRTTMFQQVQQTTSS